MKQGERKGYLNESYRLFHLKDKKKQDFTFHYHEFNKIVIFIAGRVTYIIEGKAYVLQPWDILLVNHHDVHQPIVDEREPYERMIIWVNSSFVQAHNNAGCNLEQCFVTASEQHFNLVRLEESRQQAAKAFLVKMEEAEASTEFGAKIISRAVFLEFLVWLNRLQLDERFSQDKEILPYDHKIEQILTYINQNLCTELSIDTIAGKFYLSKHYLMHKFKKETGYTIHQYIMQKRMMKAIEMIRQGMSITKASQECGFNDYSGFLRLFKKKFKNSPRKWLS